MAVKIGSLFGTVSLDTTKLDKDIAKVGRDLTKLGNSFKNVGASMTRYLTAPAVAVGAVAVKQFANFEQAMLKVQAISGASVVEFTALEKSARTLGRTTRYSSSQVAGLQLNLSKLGLSPDEILKSTDGILRLAQATDEDLGETATVVAGTMRAFGLDASETGRITDVMAAAFSNSALDLEKFKIGMGTLGPVANEYGLSIEQASAMLAVLVNRNVEASTAGTGLRNMLLDMTGSGMSLDEAYKAINESTSRAATAFDLFGKRGATVAVILATTMNEAANLAEKFLWVEGIAKKMSEVMDSGLTGSFFRFKSIMQETAITIGELLGPYVEKFMETISELAIEFLGLDKATQYQILGWIALVAVVGPLLIIAGTLLVALGAVAAATSALVAFTMALGTTFHLVVVAVVAMVAIFWSAVQVGEWLGEKLYELGVAAIEAGKKFGGGFLGGLKAVWDFIKNSMFWVIDQLIQKLNYVWNLFKSVASAVGSLNPFSGGGGIDGARAEGGPVNAGGTYLVGENGPELFSPRYSGNITSNEDMNAGGGITMNFSVGTSMETVAALKNMKNTIAKIAVAAVKENTMRTA
tara:strand:+ start:1393 stop:3138 length:1746 start_codon:yes stop_codon:yes gene_type:complete